MGKPALVNLTLPARARRALRIAMLVHNMIEKLRFGRTNPPATMLLGIQETSLGRFIFTFESWNNSPGWVVNHAAEVAMTKVDETWRCSEVSYLFYNFHGFEEDPPDTIIHRRWRERSLTHLIRRAMIPTRFFVSIPSYDEEWHIVQNMSNLELLEHHPGLCFEERLHESHPLVSWREGERINSTGGQN